ncbi:IS5 family transposase [Pseudomonas syringae]
MQKTFSELEYTGKKKQTRRDRFLADLEQLVPWAHLEAQVAPFYSNTAGKRGRPAIGVSRMLRMYVVQQCFGFSDEGCEDAVYDSQAIRGFMGIDLGRESAPDATTLLRFRRLLEANQLTRLLFETINQHLASRGLLLKEGTIVDATLIAAPPSVKNREGKRDPEMHQARKGNQWHFGMKAHIGVDATSGLVHSVVGTAANVADVTQVGQLLHGDETYVSGDAGYTGAAKRPEHAERDVIWSIAARPSSYKQHGEGSVERDVIWSIAARPSSYKQHGEGSVLYRVKRKIEYAKAQLRAKVEHPFQVIKVRFNHRKVRYRGLEKNTAQLFSLFGLANLMLAKRYLQQAAG